MTTIIKTGESIDQAVAAALEELQVTKEEVTIDVLKEAKAGFLGFGASDAVVRVSLKEDRFDQLLVEEAIRGTSTNDQAVSSSAASEEETEEGLDEAVLDEAEEATIPEDTDSDFAAEDEKEAYFTSASDEDDSIEEDSWDAPETADVFEDDQEDAEAPLTQETSDPLTFSIHWMEKILQEMHIRARVTAHQEEDAIFLEMTEVSEEDTGIAIGRRAETLNALQYILSIALNRASEHHYQVYVDVGGYRMRRRASIQRMAKRYGERVLENGRPFRLDPMNAYERRLVHTTIQEMSGLESASEGRDPYRRVVIKRKDPQ